VLHSVACVRSWKASRENSEVRSERRVFTSRKRSGYESSGTVWSEDRLSSKEVEKIRKWVGEKERINRKENIVLKEIRMPEDIEKEEDKRIEWVKELIKRKLAIDCRISEVRKSGPVIIAKMESEEGKKEIMKRKGKLKGDSLFIENDLNFEERKVQEKLSRWAKEKRSKGMEIKIGKGRARYRGKWVT